MTKTYSMNLTNIFFCSLKYICKSSLFNNLIDNVYFKFKLQFYYFKTLNLDLTNKSNNVKMIRKDLVNRNFFLKYWEAF